MAFSGAGTLNEHVGPVQRSQIIANSTEVTELDAVRIDSSGFVTLGNASNDIFGHVTGISTQDGVGLETDGSAGAETGSFSGTFTTASDNQTVSKVKAVVDISKESLYSADADASLGTTTGSDLAGYYMDLTSENELDESTAAQTAAQYHTHGTDPEDSTKAIVNVFESSVYGPLGA